jgi:hypothetical protein
MEHSLELELAHATLEARGVLLDIGGGRLVVLAFGKIEELCGVGDGFGRAIQLIELRGELRTLAAQLAGLVGVLPDGRLFQLANYLFEAFLLVVVLKETP